MSYCALVYFKDGKANSETRYGNSHGGSAYIWRNLYDKYLKDPNKLYDNWLLSSHESGAPLWKLARAEEVPLGQRIVHMFTFDQAIVKKENFVELAKYLREFVEFFGTQGCVCHLLEWADALEKNEGDFEAVGVHGTSVCENPWYRWDEDTDEEIPFDLSKDDHFDVFQELKSSPCSSTG